MVSIDPILFSMFYSILVGEEPDSVFFKSNSKPSPSPLRNSRFSLMTTSLNFINPRNNNGQTVPRSTFH
ncbi:unnamed protein product [Spirodela intermedia]|uniref:Uncharacterized protein n=1 Tax=Spirodela intermedia TaxID=51605 RepID=A0A7I8LKI9_SPIIN|nr:unnamed protein product [Spirodela intermedia]